MFHNTPEKNPVYNTALSILLLLLLSSWACFYKLGVPNFYDVRLESRRAEIARNMLETGDWLIPQIAGEPILTKPPIYFWAAAVCSLKTGVTELTARIPSAIAALGIIMVTFMLGRLLFNHTIGLWGALIVLVTNIFLDEARYAEMESLLVLFITGSLYFFVKGYQDPAHDKKWFILLFAMMGFGTMTKGPFAFIFPLIPVILYLVIYGEKRLLVKKTFLSGLPFFFIIIIPWVAVILALHPSFVRVFLWETVAYYAQGYGHREPFYFYLASIGNTLFPWIFFIPFAIWAAFSKRLAYCKKQNVFLLLWFLGNLLFISTSKAKRNFYVVPVVPAIALLIAATWETMWQNAADKVHARALTIQRVCFVAGACLVIISFAAGNPFEINFPGKRFPAVPVFLLFLGLNIMTAAGIKRVFPRYAIAKITLPCIIFYFLLFQYLYLNYSVPVKNTYDSGKSFYLTVPELIKPSSKLAYFGSYENYALSFYAHRPVIYFLQQEPVKAYMASPEKRYLIIAESSVKYFQDMPWNVVYKSMYSEHTAWGGYLLIANHLK